MPSRKKAKGKARKAAKAEIAAEATRKHKDLVTQLNRLEDDETCVHGYESDLICGAFVKHFLDIVVQVPLDGNPHGVATDASRAKFPQEWNSVYMLRKIDSLLLALGVNYILKGDIDLARHCASSANFFKGFIEEVFYEGRPMCMELDKTTELFVSDEHTLVRYLQKRIPCSCLDDKYEEVKGVKKIGLCCNPQCKIPDRTTERRSMLYCTRCRRVNYCSPECQEVHWHGGHKEVCEEMRMERKAYK
mmetsp:Transcript_24352/g.40172  ORF Transcript_24352/g.40172 Transcript_24352/m.40172 type:complete len:247 (-) Transcript_24352:306-1046(-)